MNAFVETTAISGPAPTDKTVFANRSSVDPRALTTATISAPCFFASLTAINVSAVSPDWEIANTKVLLSINFENGINS